MEGILVMRFTLLQHLLQEGKEIRLLALPLAVVKDLKKKYPHELETCSIALALNEARPITFSA